MKIFLYFLKGVALILKKMWMICFSREEMSFYSFIWKVFVKCVLEECESWFFWNEKFPWDACLEIFRNDFWYSSVRDVLLKKKFSWKEFLIDDKNVWFPGERSSVKFVPRKLLGFFQKFISSRELPFGKFFVKKYWTFHNFVVFWKIVKVWFGSHWNHWRRNGDFWDF